MMAWARSGGWRVGGCRKPWAPAIVALVAVSICAAGCDATSGAEGITCETDSDCTNGLKCLPAYTIVDGGCSSIGNECLQPCQTDPDCASGPSAGLGLACFTSCGSTPTCEEILEAGPEAAAEAATDGPVDASGSPETTIDGTADGSDTSTE
jgi:hypothetical protein